MSTGVFRSVDYIDGHPVIHRSYSVVGKQKVSDELKLKHGSEFMELAMALDINFLNNMQTSLVDGITPNMREDKDIQMKAYSILTTITKKATRFFCSFLEDIAVSNAIMLGAMMTHTQNPHYNNQNEIVIISVDSDIDELNAIIKRKLNYKKVNCQFHLWL